MHVLIIGHIVSLATCNSKVFFVRVRGNQHLIRLIATLKTDVVSIIKELPNELYSTAFQPGNGKPIKNMQIPSVIMHIPPCPSISRFSLSTLQGALTNSRPWCSKHTLLMEMTTLQRTHLARTAPRRNVLVSWTKPKANF